MSNIFQKKIRFLYLFLLFLFLNLVSFWLGRYVIGINPAELKALSDSIPELQLPAIGIIGETMGLGRSLASVFQLSILDLHSFLFTMGIIWIGSRSKSLKLLLIELITDISILALFFVLVFQSLYYWLVKDISLSLFGSFFPILGIGVIIWVSYIIFRYFEHLDSAVFEDRFLPLSLILILPAVAFVAMLIIALFTSFRPILDTTLLFPALLFVFLVPIIIFWSFRIFKVRPEDKVDFVVKFMLMSCFIVLLLYGIIYLINYHHLFPQLYSVFSSARISRFVFILVFSSAFPTLAHLMAIIPAIMAKATPRWLQRFINRHLNALFKNEEKVLSQLANVFGGIGALITAIIKLI